ncbi:hypothetical protein K3727_21445 (plasmid) [Rhodobacteraceae bacterium M382]|nr:hypothetical protein K3727_21445 [Rhodobacteraceae bacterium M382]
MTNTLFLQETHPLTTRDSFLTPLAETLLPSGDLARLYDTGSGDIVLEVFAPGSDAAQSQVTLPVPEGHSIEFWPLEFATAPNGTVALFYKTATYVTVENEYGSYQDVDQHYLSAVHVAADGSAVSDPVTLSSGDAYNIDWAGFAHFDGGGFAFVDSVPAFDEDMNYLGNVSRLVRTTADGVAFGADVPLPEGVNAYNTQLTALPDGELMLLWLGNSGDSYVLRGETFAADGTPGPVLELSDLGDFGGRYYYTYLQDVQVFDDGSFGVLIYSEADNVRVLYQHFAADGSALSDLTLVNEMPFWELTHDATALLPDGGVVVLRQSGTYETAEETLFVQYFDANGAPMGPETAIATEGEDYYLYNPRVQVYGDGNTVFSWWADGYTEETGWHSVNREIGYSPLPFRPLTDGDDTEILSSPDQVDGLAGDDAITGSDGIDRLLGSGGDDTLDGGAGDDFLFGGSGSNVLIGGAGTDAAWFDGDFDAFTFAFNDDGSEITVTGGDGSDRTSGVERFDFRDQSLGSDDILIRGGFYDGAETGTAGDDALDGGLGNDTLRGEDGNDLIDGGTGRDLLNGGAGNDTIVGGPGDEDQRDRIFAGAGDDSVDAGAGNDLVYGQEGNDTVVGGSGVDEIFGQGGNDVLTGSAWSDLIFGGDGDDFINGGFGHDRINGGAGADTFYHAGVRGHGSDWLQDYSAEDGDILWFGLDGATADDFRVTFAHAGHVDGARPGDADVAEAFIAHVPSGFVVWALVDGAAQDHLWLDIAGMAGPGVDLLG